MKLSSEIHIHNGHNLDVLMSLQLELDRCIFVTDPPFNVGYHYNEYEDNMDEEEYYKWLAEIFGTERHVVIHYPEHLYRYSHHAKQIPEKVVSWVYNSNTSKQHRDIAFFNVKPNFRKVSQAYKNPTDKRIAKRIAEGKKARLYDWWNVNQVKNVNTEKTSHPCQMPLAVMQNIIGILPEGYTIVDPFMGSGTTALACIKHGRKFIGIELSAQYYEISRKRITNALKTPELWAVM
jgi:site-specific DNA-methyltransferase (adenine-specific)